MQAMLDVIAPVFLVLGFGYLATWRRVIGPDAIDGLMAFTQKIAIPCLLFKGISTLDLGQNYDWRLLVSFYSGAVIGFFGGMLGARMLLGRSWEDSVAIGFGGLFSNALLLGLPITERAYGPDALEANYTIISIHAPICYGLGITAMEIVRNRGQRHRAMLGKALRAMFSNALVIGIALGFAANLTGVTPAGPVADALNLITRAALPAALFGLGGVLVRYRPEGDAKAIALVLGLSIVVHPAIAYGLGRAFDLSTEQLRSAVLTAAMAPGVNTYIFANMYGAARRVAASVVLIGTALSIFTIWGWLQVLP
ncbi:AEC family transporter [Actibacterium sp. XHP0104]|uniref:AEC family transporter n=1 Tax=Actibacterium sp. XHP0104 TaxID=2984335 RepID=UPI0021E72BD9|nr:AEC family transporter [Actibacterium sp. XHP0104]MCV2882524.1 AEC family transporter [Actibacterium sp. XHP0104]